MNDFDNLGIPKLSTGEDSTLGTYLKYVLALSGNDENNEAVKYMRKTITEHKRGEAEPVLADEGQVISFLMNLLTKR